MRSTRRPFFAHVPEAGWFVCPECGGKPVPCDHCGGRGWVLCGPSFHEGPRQQEWPEAGGFLRVCTNCGSSFIEITEHASQNVADGLDVTNGSV